MPLNTSESTKTCAFADEVLEQMRGLENRLESLERNLSLVDTILPRLQKLEVTMMINDSAIPGEGATPGGSKVGVGTPVRSMRKRTRESFWRVTRRALGRDWKDEVNPSLHKRHTARLRFLERLMYVSITISVAIYSFLQLQEYVDAQKRDNFILKLRLEPLKVGVDKFPGILLCKPLRYLTMSYIKLCGTEEADYLYSGHPWCDPNSTSSPYVAACQNGAECPRRLLRIYNFSTQCVFGQCFCHIILPILIQDPQDRLWIGTTAVPHVLSARAEKEVVAPLSMFLFDESLLGSWDPASAGLPARIQRLILDPRAPALVHQFSDNRLTLLKTKIIREGGVTHRIAIQTSVEPRWFRPMGNAFSDFNIVIRTTYDVIGHLSRIESTISGISSTIYALRSSLAILSPFFGGRRLSSCMCPKAYPRCSSSTNKCYKWSWFNTRVASTTCPGWGSTCTVSYKATTMTSTTATTATTKAGLMTTHNATTIMPYSGPVKSSPRVAINATPNHTSLAYNMTTLISAIAGQPESAALNTTLMGAVALNASISTPAPLTTSSTTLSTFVWSTTAVLSDNTTTLSTNLSACMCPAQYPYCNSGTRRRIRRCYKSQFLWMFTSSTCPGWNGRCSAHFSRTASTTSTVGGGTRASSSNASSIPKPTRTTRATTSLYASKIFSYASAGYQDFQIGTRSARISIALPPTMTQEVQEYVPRIVLVQLVANIGGWIYSIKGLVSLFLLSFLGRLFAPNGRRNSFVRNLKNSIQYINPEQTNNLRFPANSFSPGQCEKEERYETNRYRQRLECMLGKRESYHGPSMLWSTRQGSDEDSGGRNMIAVEASHVVLPRQHDLAKLPRVSFMLGSAEEGSGGDDGAGISMPSSRWPERRMFSMDTVDSCQNPGTAVLVDL